MLSSQKEDEREWALELLYGLPSKRMVDVCRMVVFTDGEDKFCIKSGYGDEETWDIMQNGPFVHYQDVQPMNHDYRELSGKNVIFDKCLLNGRGQEAYRRVFKKGEDA